MPTTDHDVPQRLCASEAPEETRRNAELTTEAFLTSHGLVTRAGRPPFRRDFVKCCHCPTIPLSLSLWTRPSRSRSHQVSTLFACDPSPQSSPLFHSRPHLAQPPLTRPRATWPPSPVLAIPPRRLPSDLAPPRRLHTARAHAVGRRHAGGRWSPQHAASLPQTSCTSRAWAREIRNNTRNSAPGLHEGCLVGPGQAMPHCRDQRTTPGLPLVIHFSLPRHLKPHPTPQASPQPNPNAAGGPADRTGYASSSVSGGQEISPCRRSSAGPSGFHDASTADACPVSLATVPPDSRTTFRCLLLPTMEGRSSHAEHLRLRVIHASLRALVFLGNRRERNPQRFAEAALCVTPLVRHLPRASQRRATCTTMFFTPHADVRTRARQPRRESPPVPRTNP